MIVLVLYHGEEEWTAPEELEDLFALEGIPPSAREALRPYLPKQRYLLEVLPDDPHRLRSGRGAPRIALLALKFGRSPERWSVIFGSEDDLRALLSNPALLLHMAALLVEYLMSVNAALTPERLSEAMQPMGTEAQELPKTYLSLMVEKSREEGRDAGRLEEKREVARKALAKGLSPQVVADLTDLPLDEVLKLAH